MAQQASRFQQAVLKALPGKLDIKRHSPSILYLSHEDASGSYTMTCNKIDKPLLVYGFRNVM